ncbi:hypothetical protein FFL01_32930 [Flavobacterium flevense]|uniref:Uncharacterized protein n=1 Tax=Flavobacterium flevense TaxID=983 RepID=A0A4Y4B4B4_9FLAO|nr:hypothetical protein FFL01_32930 [Flavobacterium flevense]
MMPKIKKVIIPVFKRVNTNNWEEIIGNIVKNKTFRNMLKIPNPNDCFK